MNVSMKTLQKKYKLDGLTGEWFSADDEISAFIREALEINAYGGPVSMSGILYNKINSPGLKYLFWWF